VSRDERRIGPALTNSIVSVVYENQNCTSAVLRKVLNLEYLRFTYSSTSWIENDAKGCSDNVIPSAAVSNSRRYGAPMKESSTLAHKSSNLTHAIKTSHGTSSCTYHAQPEEYHACTNQGYCLALLIWKTISTQILKITKEVP